MWGFFVGSFGVSNSDRHHIKKTIKTPIVAQNEHFIRLFDEKTSIYEQIDQYIEYVKKPDFLLSEPRVQLNNARHRGQPCNRFQQR